MDDHPTRKLSAAEARNSYRKRLLYEKAHRNKFQPLKRKPYMEIGGMKKGLVPGSGGRRGAFMDVGAATTDFRVWENGDGDSPSHGRGYTENTGTKLKIFMA